MTEPAPAEHPAPPPPPAPEFLDADAIDARDRRVELLISRLLRVGVLASLLFVTVGTVVGFVGRSGYGTTDADVRRLTSEQGEFPRTWAWLVDGVSGVRGPTLVVIGLIALMATPILRVCVSMAVFAAQRDRVFVLVTLAVLGLLAASFFLGKVEP